METNKELEAMVKRLQATLDKLLAKNELLKKTFLNTNEAANLLGKKPRTLREYHASGRLVGRQYTKHGMLHFQLVDVLEFQKEQLKEALYFEKQQEG